jgi:hypothetical protein
MDMGGDCRLEFRYTLDQFLLTGGEDWCLGVGRCGSGTSLHLRGYEAG